MEAEIERKENYFLGAIGAILIGLVVAIPLVFAYIYSQWSILLGITVAFPFLEFYGYKWFKGKIDSKLPIILLITTIINILIMTLLFIPMVLTIKSNLPVSTVAIKSIYADTKTSLVLAQDCLISLVISLFGVYIVSAIIKRKLLLNIDDINLFSSDNKERIDLKERAISVLKPKFEKHGAMQKKKTISKEEILADIKEANSKDYFDYLKQLYIIKKYKGKYYYSENDEKNVQIHYQTEKIIGGICLVAVLIVIILFSFGAKINKTTQKIYNNDVSFSIDTSWTALNDYSESTGWVYYRKVNTYTESIGIDYDKTASKLYESINDLKTMLEAYINSSSNYDEYGLGIFTTDKGYDAVEVVLKYDGITEYDYYIYKDGKTAYVTAISYSSDEDMLYELAEYAKDVVNSFKWNK